MMIDFSVITYFKSNDHFNGCFQAFPELTNNWFVHSLTNYRLSNILTCIVPLLLVGTLSMAIIVKLVRMKQIGNRNLDQLARQERRNIQIIKMLLLIIIVFYVLTGMSIYYSINSTFADSRDFCRADQAGNSHVPPFFIFMCTMVRFGCISNPIILILFNKTFGSEFIAVMDTFICWSRGQNRNEIDQDEIASPLPAPSVQNI